MSDTKNLVKRLGAFALGFSLVGWRALPVPASLCAATAHEKKVVPIGYPPGFEERKREAEARREAKEAEREAASDTGAKVREGARELPHPPPKNEDGGNR